MFKENNIDLLDSPEIFAKSLTILYNTIIVLLSHYHYTIIHHQDAKDTFKVDKHYVDETIDLSVQCTQSCVSDDLFFLSLIFNQIQHINLYFYH